MSCELLLMFFLVANMTSWIALNPSIGAQEKSRCASMFRATGNDNAKRGSRYPAILHVPVTQSRRLWQHVFNNGLIRTPDVMSSLSSHVLADGFCFTAGCFAGVVTAIGLITAAAIIESSRSW